MLRRLLASTAALATCFGVATPLGSFCRDTEDVSTTLCTFKWHTRALQEASPAIAGDLAEPIMLYKGMTCRNFLTAGFKHEVRVHVPFR